ncbi:amino acid adenylation domain-containing protein, partial [Pedobacter terrae]
MELKNFFEELSRLNIKMVKNNDLLTLTGIDRSLTADEKKELLKHIELINFIKQHKEELHSLVDEEHQPNEILDSISAIYPLSPVQEGMLFHSLYDEHSTSYLNQFQCNIHGDLNLELFKMSWELVIQKHTILRSGFHNHGFSLPVQSVHNQVELPFKILDFTEQNHQHLLQEFLQQDRSQRFDMEKPPLMRVTIIRIHSQEHILVWTCHHIAKDGWSSGIICNEVLDFYQELLKGNTPEIKVDQFQHYIEFLKGRDQHAEEVFWKKYLNGCSPATLLPFADTKSSRNNGIGEYREITCPLDGNLKIALEKYIQKNRLTTSTLFQGIWAYLCHIYTGQQDLVFGVTVSGRPAELENTEKRVGLFINTIPFRARIEQDQKISEWLADIQIENSKCREFQYTSISNIKNWNLISNDLFDSIFVFENYPDYGTRSDKIKVDQIKTHGITNYMLTIAAWDGERTGLSFGFNNNLINETSVNQIASHFLEVLEQIVLKSINIIGQLNPLNSKSEAQLLTAFQGKTNNIDKQGTILDLFENQVSQKPNSIAAVYGNSIISYQKLDEIANSIAWMILDSGAKKGCFIPLLMDEGINFAVAFLAVLKADCAAVPLDKKWPKVRIDNILNKLDSNIILYEQPLSYEFSGSFIFLEVNEKHLAQTKIPPVRNTLPQDPIYMIFTSGSTGNPKGVIVPHLGIINRFSWMDSYFCESFISILKTTRNVYDSAIWQLFWPLTNGGKTVIPDEERALDFGYLLSLIEHHQVSMTDFVPSLFNSLVQWVEKGDSRLSTLRDLIIGGEEIELSATMLFRNYFPDIRITNLYGPTEASIGCIFYSLSRTSYSKIPIGIPIFNVSIHLLDTHASLVPLGVSGEIYIEGPCLADGYFKDVEETQQRFIIPKSGPLLGRRLYRSGDFARRLPDGNIIFQGRIDEQVKIRGFRIELGEIESVISQIPEITKAVVISYQGTSRLTYLVAYVNAVEFNRIAIINFLSSRLPDYMVPSFIVHLESMPLTANGKIDKSKLPLPDMATASERTFEPPRTATESKLAQIWEELLSVTNVGIYDHFFEMGGHSLLAIRLVSAIRKVFDTEIRVKLIFELPLLKDLAVAIDENAIGNTLPPITPGIRTGRIPLSYSQESLWVIDKVWGSLQY